MKINEIMNEIEALQQQIKELNVHAVNGDLSNDDRDMLARFAHEPGKVWAAYACLRQGWQMGYKAANLFLEGIHEASEAFGEQPAPEEITSQIRHIKTYLGYIKVPTH